MFFGKEPERKFPHAIIRCVRFKGKDKVHIIDDKSFGGPLYEQYQDTLSWIESKLEVEYIIEGTGPRKEIWEIPLDVFKEAVMNAICHRDLYEEGATVMVEVYDDRVEISNPGGLLPVVAEKFGEKSMSRNPLIFGLFTRMHLVEKVGSGIPRMRRLMKEAGLPEPIFDTRGFFTVTFMKRVKENIGSFDDPINRSNDPLTKRSGTLNDTLNDPLKGKINTINCQNNTINGSNDSLTKSSGTLNGTLKNNHQVLSLIKKQLGIRIILYQIRLPLASEYYEGF